ncbi:heat-inducible transcriptional repressor HrcA [Spiroplasma endosymbiont of Aspidapion aeneum]|uniref:heat-inducible transcriptional repressor HrcA n=1 Tax=Spiroplasma endosymbiont of Aspidapion aeneum TaxID=3066276 RepID=UPI00313A9AF7
MKNIDNINLSERQKKILKIVVEEYIDNVIPVGSNKIKTLMGVDISTATIRNESVHLEELGYLEKSHTSSGRIPSTTGYRYYVDTLMPANDLLKEAIAKVDEVFSKREVSIEKLLDETAKLVSDMTNLVTVVETKDVADNVMLSKIEIIPLKEDSAAMIVVLSNGNVQNKVIDIQNEVSMDDLQKAIVIFNERLVNTPLSEIEEKIKLVAPIIKTQVEKYEFVLKAFISAILNEQAVNLKTQGMKNLLLNPEFQDPGMIQQIISVIENASLLTLFDSEYKDFDENDHFDKPNIKIGEETGISKNISLVGKNVKLMPGREASLTVVGPKRIHYQMVSAILERFSHNLREKNTKKRKGD